jgi:putative inorganic carbon (hco3(-)) transporter
MSRFAPSRAARLADPAHAAAGAVLPWDGLLICVAALLLVAMARTHSFVPGMDAVRPALLLTGLGVLLYFATSSQSRALQQLKHPMSYCMLFLVGWAMLGAPFALVKTTSVMFLLNDFLRTVVFAVLVAACVRNLYDVRRLAMTLAVGGMVFSLFAALPAGYRSVSAGGYDPNDSAMFIVLTMPITAYFLIQERRLAFKILFAVALLVCTAAVVRTGSRGGFLALAAVVGYMVFLFHGVKPFFRVLTVGAVVAVMAITATEEFWNRMETINDPDDYNYTELSGRKQIWQRAREYTAANPLLGVGIANFPNAEGRHPVAVAQAEAGSGFKWSVAHSIWYTVGPELGIPGLLAFIGIFVVAIVYLRRVNRLARASPRAPPLQEASGLASALIGSLVGIMVAGTFLSTSYSPMVWGVFALILGLFKALRLEGLDVGRAATGGGQPLSAGLPLAAPLPQRLRYRPSVYRPAVTPFHGEA